MITITREWIPASSELLDLSGKATITLIEDGKARTILTLDMSSNQFHALSSILSNAERAGRQEVAEYIKTRLSTLIPEHLL
jgi:hypothetical protein